MSRRWLLVAAGAGVRVGTVPLRDALPVAAGSTPADELTPVGERDVYRLDGREYVWDFDFDQLTMLSGDAALRLPRAADLLPPDLGRRLLRLAPDDPVTPLPARRIAGLRTEGLRLTPSDPDTTIGRIDVWADPVTGLPLHVEVAPRSDPGVPLLASAIQEVVLEPPAPTALVPPRPPGSSRVQAKAAELGGALRVLDAPDPPVQLAGRHRVTLTGEQLPGVGVYGTGSAGFVLVPVSRGIAGRVLDGAAAAGGVPIEVPRGRAVRICKPLLSLAVRGGRSGGVLLVGTVRPPAIVAGDAVAGEASAGTLRYLLVRPVGRLRLLVAKLVSITVFVLLAVLFVTVTGYLVGVALFGFGPDAELGGAGGVTSLFGAVLSPAELLARTALVVGYLALCMLALGAVGLFFSTLTDSPLAAALGVLALVVASAALQPLDAAAALEPYLPTAHWLAWIDLYRDPILWPAVREGAAVQAGYVLVAFGAAWANLATKDITS